MMRAAQERGGPPVHAEPVARGIEQQVATTWRGSGQASNSAADIQSRRRPSPSPVASSGVPPVSSMPPVTSFSRPTAGLLSAPAQPPGARLAKGGEESRELGFFSSAPTFLLQSQGSGGASPVEPFLGVSGGRLVGLRPKQLPELLEKPYQMHP
jgi:hypothetical protein